MFSNYVDADKKQEASQTHVAHPVCKLAIEH